MPLPLAAIAAAVTTAALTHYQQQQRDSAVGGPPVGKLVIGGKAVRASTVQALLGGAGGSNFITTPEQSAGIAAAINAIAPTTMAVNTNTRPGAAGTGAQGMLTNAQLNRALGVTVTQPTGQLMFRGRRRRINVANVPALRRAGRRLSGFVKLAKKMVTLETKARIKKRRRR